MSFHNKVVLITGASSGIGGFTAVEFAKASAKLALVGRNAQNLDTIAEACEKFSATTLKIIADLTNDEDVRRIVETTIEKFGQIDVLVNNAGFGILKTFEDTSMEEYDAVMATNTRSIFLLTKTALPYLIETKGNIINISSSLSTMASTGFTAYGMTKAAIDQFTRYIALELAPKGVRVNAVSPGCTNNYTADQIANENFVKDSPEFLTNQIPLGRMVESKDIASMVQYLASEEARNITGANFVVDGGLKLKHLVMSTGQEK